MTNICPYSSILAPPYNPQYTYPSLGLFGVYKFVIKTQDCLCTLVIYSVDISLGFFFFCCCVAFPYLVIINILPSLTYCVVLDGEVEWSDEMAARE